MSKKTLFIFAAVAVALILGGYAITAVVTNNNETKNEQAAQQKTSEDGSEVPDIEERQKSTEPGTVSISSTSQDGENVYVRTIINGVGQGQCTLELTMDGQQTITKTAQIIPATSYYTCEGFNVAKTEFPSKGTWSVKVRLDNNNEATGTVDVQ